MNAIHNSATLTVLVNFSIRCGMRKNHLHDDTGTLEYNCATVQLCNGA